MKRVLILHYHEIWLKGGNKNYFLSRLREAIKLSVADLPVESLEGSSERLLLTPGDEAAVPELLARLRRVFGLAYIAVARQVSWDRAELAAEACRMMAELRPRTFAVRTKIADSRFGQHTMELERELGRAILDHLRAQDASVRVHLDDPEATCWVEVIPGRALLYAQRVDGAGGLPSATSGRLVVLLSGGFDSAVAAYKMMRRGAHVSFAHFFGSPSPSRNSSRGVAEQLVRTLTPYQLSSRLFLVPFDAVQRQVVAGARESYRILLYRRLMARMAREIARAEHALGLITGDSVSQVASQTLHNLAAIDRGLEFPVYRPLAGDDKSEILRLARQIGTYTICCEPFEDCCPRFMPRSPAIFAEADDVVKAESALEVDALVTMALETASVRDFKYERGAIVTREGLPHRFTKLLAWRKRAAGQPAPPPVPSTTT